MLKTIPFNTLILTIFFLKSTIFPMFYCLLLTISPLVNNFFHVKNMPHHNGGTA